MGYLGTSCNGLQGVEQSERQFADGGKSLAIVGMACRFAGGICNPEDLWDFVSQGKSAWSEIPESRFNLAAFYHDQADKTGTTHIRGGYFLDEDVGLFDPAFFNLSASVAAAMDPQIRMMLELTYESLESAGIPMENISGSNTSVFAGTFTKDYHDQLLSDPLTTPQGFITGNYSAMVANRISHFFDLKGLSAAIDTGCSTSMMGLHLASQSLRSGESDCVILGGGCVNLNPEIFANLSTLGSCGPDGKCFAFDHRAQGYGRGEGVAVLVVKRLEDALKSGDPIRAVIRETAVNQDGRTATITSPDATAQQELIRICYEKVGLDPLDTVAVEAHGTGTAVGDPVEADAIGRALRPPHRRDTTNPAYIASVKTNIGHTEAASGFAALIKMAKSLEHRQLAPSINFEKANPNIDLEGLGLKVVTDLKPWPVGRALRASINNFGYGGTNTHAIIESSPRSQEALEITNERVLCGEVFGSKLLILSARDEKATREMAKRLRIFLSQKKHVSLRDLAYTLGQRRSKFSWNMAFIARSIDHITELLSDNSSVRPTLAASHKPRLGFVFSGQGAQYFSMGRELMAVYPVYLQTLQECDDAIRRLGADWSLVDELRRDQYQSRVDQVRFSMPLTCAVQLALVRLLANWGIKPTAVTGHSTGEVAAAFAAGALSLDEAMACSYCRGAANFSLIEKQKSPAGGMLAVGLSEDQVKPYMSSMSTKVTIACFNSPYSVTLSGDMDRIEELEQKLKSDGVFARKLKVQTAFHSHHMIPLAESYLSFLETRMSQSKRYFTDSVRFYSPVSGEAVEDAELLGPSHWVDNMLLPVLFTQSFNSMVLGQSGASKGTVQNIDFVVEIGAHNVLAGPIRQSLSQPSMKDLSIGYGFCLERGKDAVETLQNLAGKLIQAGHPVDLSKINFTNSDGHDVVAIPDLPTYPWNHTQRFWTEPRRSEDHRFRKLPYHDLLGLRVPGLSGQAQIWRNILQCSDLPWMRDHVVQAQIVYPGAGYISMAIEALRRVLETKEEGIQGYILKDVEISKAVVVPDTAQGVELQLSLETPDGRSLSSGWHRFRISATSNKDSTWYEASSGWIRAQQPAGTSMDHRYLKSKVSVDTVDSAANPGNFPKEMRSKDLFKKLRDVGIYHGPLFQNLGTEIKLAEGKSSVNIVAPDRGSIATHQYQKPHVVHPITLDSVFLAAYSSLLATANGAKMVGAAVPRSIKWMYISSNTQDLFGSKPQLRSRSVLRQYNKRGFNISSVVKGDEEVAVIEIDDMFFQSLGHDSEEEEVGNLCVLTNWKRSFNFNDATPLVQSLQSKAPEDEVNIGRDLVRSAYYLISDALGQLTADDIDNLEWHHKRLYMWMQLLKKQAALNALSGKSSQWAASSEGTKQIIIDRAERSSVNGALSVRIGKNLVGIMRKETAPLELMLQDQLLYTFYKQCLHFPRSASHCAALLRSMAEENPRIRILEIGAGTGGCTMPVLQALGGTDGTARLFDSYIFTDISMGFFQSAREMLAGWGDSISYATLDIEKDPATQGFEPGSFDIVIAAQVLHATKNINSTMSNVRKLLKDSGKLVLIETNRDTAEMHLIFGVLPGWWLSEEPERQYSPTMSLEAWDSSLTQTGFTGLDASIWDCDDEGHQTMSCIVSSVKTEPKRDFGTTATLLYNGVPPPHEWTEMLVENFRHDLGVAVEVKELTEFQPGDGPCILLFGLDDAGSQIDEATFDAIKKLIMLCKRLLWVTAGSAVDCEIPENAIHLGLLRTARVEDTSKRYVSLDLDPQNKLWTVETQYFIQKVFSNTMDRNTNTQGLDYEYAIRNSEFLLPRAYLDDQQNSEVLDGLREKQPEMQKFFQDGRPLRMYVENPGLLDSIVFKDDPDVSKPLPQGFVEIEPNAFGLNFRDVMGAMGMLKEDKQEIGVECAGTVKAISPPSSISPQCPLRVGDRVCCLSVNGHFASRVRIPWTSAVRIPDSMPFDNAASFPLAFVTAYHSMFEAGRCTPKDTLLIHAASGGVGQACISLAQWKGIKNILVTAGTQEKRDFLVAKYGIPPEHAFSSRDTTFVQGVLEVTGGRGVDVVINSLTGDLLHESWKLLTTYGRFIEIGKRDIQLNHSLDMEPFQKALSFVHVDIKEMCSSQGPTIQRELQQVLSLVSSAGILSITPVETMPLGEASRAFRKMQAGKHIGKIVLIPREDELVKTVPALKKAVLRPDATYMIVGGATGIGLSITKWLIERGAQSLLVISRNAESRAPDFAMSNANVVVRNCDAADEKALRNLIDDWKASGRPDIRGVVYCGMVLDDAILEHMSFGQWNRALRPKLIGTRNIHNLLGNSVEFLVLLSSGCGVLGNTSQANYAAGNTYQDALARHRSANGLPAVCIDLGAVESVGFVANTLDDGVGNRLFKVSGHRPLTEMEVLGLVESAIRDPLRPPRTSQIASGLSGSGAVAQTDPRFFMLHNSSDTQQGKSSTSGTGRGLGTEGEAMRLYDLIKQAESSDMAVKSIQQAVGAKISTMFALGESEVDPSKSLTFYGVDSLVAVELRNWLVPNARIEMSIFELLASSSLGDLASEVVKRVQSSFSSA